MATKKPLTKRNADNEQVVSIAPNKGDKKTFYTYNWADRTTWYSQAVRQQVTASHITGTGEDYQNYSLGGNCMIDAYHGKITQEDFLKDADGYSYRLQVSVNGTASTEEDPHYGAGHGDFKANYISGTIRFHNALSASDEVTATYHKESGSLWILKPDQGKIVEITRVEVQFSEDIVLHDSIVFQGYGMVNHFAPQLTPTPYPSGTLIPLGDPDVYKTMADYYNDANGAFPVIPALGGNGWRGFPVEVHSFPWQYQTATRIEASKGMEVRIKLDHDEPFSGSSATATFYCLIEDE